MTEQTHCRCGRAAVTLIGDSAGIQRCFGCEQDIRACGCDKWAEHCDFCTDESPTFGAVAWVYPCRDFVVYGGPVEHRMHGEWAACETCSSYIEAGRWDDLATYVSRHYPELVKSLHKQFKAHRTGPRYAVAKAVPS